MHAAGHANVRVRRQVDKILIMSLKVPNVKFDFDVWFLTLRH